MAIRGISTFETEKYISKTDPAKTEQDGATIFELGSLDVDMKARILDTAVSVIGEPGKIQKITTHNNAVNVEAVRFGLRGWKNFLDRDGKQIPFKAEKESISDKEYKVVSRESLNNIPMPLIIELGERILTVNNVDAEKAKKSKTE